MYEIPYGGNSLATPFTVSYGPDIGFEIALSFVGTYPGISLDRRNVIFRAGQQSSYFTLYSSNATENTVTKGSIALSLTGVNKEVYALPTNVIDFQIIDPDLTPPDITELSVSDITQNSAVITIGSSEICMAYYMIALDGTVTPSFEEIKSGGPAPYASTSSVYGSIQIGRENRVSFTIDGLTAETPYAVYVYAEDRGGNTNDPKVKSFQTLDRYNAADFSLRFKQAFLNSAERLVVINQVAFVLSLFPNKYIIVLWFVIS